MKSKILYFLLGGAIGFFTAKHVYQKIANEEIASVVEEFNKLKKDKIIEKDHQETNENLKKAEAIRKNYSSSAIEKSHSNSEFEKITDSEFDTFEDERHVPYATTTLYCFEDGVIADRENEVFNNIKGLIGTDVINFDRYGDALYFRNHRLKMDIEILRDERNFSDVKKHEQYYEEDD